MSQADLFLCMTQDALPANEDLIGNLVKAFENPLVKPPTPGSCPGKTALWRNGLPVPSIIRLRAGSRPRRILRRWASKPSSAPTSALPMTGRPTANWGGFPEQAGFNEDMIYASKVIRAGYAVCLRGGGAGDPFPQLYGAPAVSPELRPGGLPGGSSGNLREISL